MKITQSQLRQIIRETLVNELRSPVGDSTAELLTDIDEVLQVLSGISDDAPIKLKVIIRDAMNSLRAASNADGRKIASVLSKVLKLVHADEIDAPGLILRLETLLRRSLPVAGDYDMPQSHLQPPFDPSKAGRYTTTSRL